MRIAAIIALLVGLSACSAEEWHKGMSALGSAARSPGAQWTPPQAPGRYQWSSGRTLP